jgi:hypothetical protein
MGVRLHTAAVPGRLDPLEPWHGLHEYEVHRVPVGAMILDAKYCELCGCTFLRNAKSKNRYCSNCRHTILALNAQRIKKRKPQLIH